MDKSNITVTMPVTEYEKLQLQEQFNQYYAEYIQNNQDKGFDLFTLTNNAIAYCMDKLGLPCTVK